MRREVTLAMAALLHPVLAAATDIGVVAKKLVLIDRAAGEGRTVFSARDDAITKGAATDVDQIGVALHVAYGNGTTAGSFIIPVGAAQGWLRNDQSLAKFKNESAPGGPTQASIAIIKPRNTLKLVAEGVGDIPVDTVGGGDPAPATVRTAYCVTNGGEENCHCSEFTGCTYKLIARGTGAKLVCKTSSADPTCGAVCENLQPTTDPATNFSNIQGCLDRYGRARLNAGVYPVNNTITLPTAGQLLGAGTTYPTIRKVGTEYNPLISVAADNTRVAFLTLDGNNAWGGEDWNRSLVAVRGSNNRIDNNIISNPAPLVLGSKSIGVYFNPHPNPGTSTGNLVVNCDISNLFYGVIFGPATELNVHAVDQTTIHNNKCDGVTFTGYGQVYNSRIYENGYDCENGPIPGAAIYSLGNAGGGVITGNTMYNNCGNNVDIVDGSGFYIEDNSAYDPGYQWQGARPYCSGAFSVQLVGTSDSTIRNNVIVNNNRPWNRVSNNSNTAWFQSGSGSPYSDVPGGGEGVIALILAAFDGDVPAVNNIIEGNEIRSYCVGGCLGIGYFASRGTGYDDGGNWMPSFFTGNDPFGSQVGSKRCGGNWYAGNSSCQQGSAAPCNEDDYQHNPPVGDQFRNDFCNFY